MKNLENKADLFLTNTLTQQKEKFIPIDDKAVWIYVCGITPYDYAHIGHGRCYVFFDLFYRLLKFLGYNPKYCRNFTDIDDKLINRAKHEYNNAEKFIDIANFYINAFWSDMKALNCLPADIEPRVTQVIPDIISFISGLTDNGKAYVSDGDVYFSIDSFKSYGKLSKRDLTELQAGARVAVRDDKHNPLDFALWKKSEEPPYWQSPWGYGRPGWAIECSVMASKSLGQSIDIHGGGMDLIFPHHENEIAQSEGLHGKTFANYWLHIAFVRINKEKMSKSLGNFITLHDIYTKFNPMVLRYYYLINHYCNPMDFSFDDIEAAGKSYNRLAKIFSAHTFDSEAALSTSTVGGLRSSSSVEHLRVTNEGDTLTKKLIESLCDDLNVSKFFGILFDNLKELQQNAEQMSEIKYLLTQVLGLTMEPLPEAHVVITPEIQELINRRQQARRDKNWQLADQIRDRLTSMGVDVQDKKI